MNLFFQNPWLWLWALVALVPIALYLWRHRTPHQVAWGAMRVLRAAARQSQPARRIQNALLLAVRILLPILVACLVATPGCPTRSSPAGEAVVHWILVLDNSASMGPVDSGPSTLNEAHRNARAIVESASPGDRFSIASSGRLPLVVHANNIVDSNIAVRQIESIEQGAGKFRIDHVFDWISKEVNNSPEADPLSFRCVLISDFADTEWETTALPTGWPKSNLHQIEFAQCEGPVSNAAVTSVIAERSSATVGQQVFIHAEIVAYGTAIEQPIELTCRVDGELVATQQVELPVDGRPQTVPLTFEANRAGWAQVEIAIEASGKTMDDRRRVVIPIRKRLEVLCLTQEPEMARSLQAATSPVSQAGQPAIALATMTPAQVDLDQLETFDLIVVVDEGPKAVESYDVLGEYLRTGGNVIVSMGPGASVEAWQRLAGAFGELESAMELKSLADVGDYRLDPIDFEHPALSAFRDQSESGLTSAPVSRYWRAQIDSNRVRQVLDFDSGDPAVFEMNIGQGRLMVTTTPIHLPASSEAAWNQLPAWWSYVPLVNELVSWMTSRVEQDLTFEAGDDWTIALDVPPLQEKVFVEGPAVLDQTVNVQRGPDVKEEVVVRVIRPGFLQIRIQPDEGPIVFSGAANVPASEAWVQVADLSELQQAVAERTESSANRAIEITQRSKFWYVALLSIVLVLLVLEPWLAHRPRRLTSEVRS